MPALPFKRIPVPHGASEPAAGASLSGGHP